MDIYDEFPSSFFKATELVGKKLPVTITTVEKTEMNDGKTKPVLKFEEDTSGLGLERREPDRLGGTVWPRHARMGWQEGHADHAAGERAERAMPWHPVRRPANERADRRRDARNPRTRLRPSR